MIALSLQHADQEDIAEERGEASLQQAIDAFRTFPWDVQLAEANRLQICSPTLFLKNSSDGLVFFASLMLGSKLDFMLFYEAPEEKETRTLFGRRKKQSWVGCDSSGHNAEEVEAAIQAVYADDKSKLKELICE